MALRPDRVRPCLLIFYPHNPFNPKHGSHLRCLQQLIDLSAQYRIIFASSLATSDSEWPRSTQKLEEVALRQNIDRICIFEYNLFGRVYRLISLAVRLPFRVFSWSLSGRVDQELRRLFHQAWISILAIRYQPRALIVHYTTWSYLANCIGVGIRVLELHDLLPVNHYLNEVVVSLLQGKNPDPLRVVGSSVGYISHVDQLPQQVVAEVGFISQNLNQYDLVWMISARESQLLRQLGMHSTSDVVQPVTRAAPVFSEKNLPPILPIGPNPFNTYSLARFIDDVIPLLDAQLLALSEIQVTGIFWHHQLLNLPRPLKYYGVVDDYVERLSRSAFMISPTSVGTGQQIKIFEALGAGIPVIAYRSAVPADVLNDYPSIIAVDNPRDFAAMINRLLSNSDLRDHYCGLAQDGAKRQAAYRLQHPYCHSLKRVLSTSNILK